MMQHDLSFFHARRLGSNPQLDASFNLGNDSMDPGMMYDDKTEKSTQRYRQFLLLVLKFVALAMCFVLFLKFFFRADALSNSGSKKGFEVAFHSDATSELVHSVTSPKAFNNGDSNSVSPSATNSATNLNKGATTLTSVLPFEGCIDYIPQPDHRQHIVPPPLGDVTLVCCNTTVGALTIEVHPTWAPHGAERFLYMVKNKFFSTKVALFRALKNFLVQFGLSGDPAVQKQYHELGAC